MVVGPSVTMRDLVAHENVRVVSGGAYLLVRHFEDHANPRDHLRASKGLAGILPPAANAGSDVVLGGDFLDMDAPVVCVVEFLRGCKLPPSRCCGATGQ